jgi:hypothetical protein
MGSKSFPEKAAFHGLQLEFTLFFIRTAGTIIAAGPFILPIGSSRSAVTQ